MASACTGPVQEMAVSHHRRELLHLGVLWLARKGSDHSRVELN